jgi:hypothetical protein
LLVYVNCVVTSFIAYNLYAKSIIQLP